MQPPLLWGRWVGVGCSVLMLEQIPPPILSCSPCCVPPPGACQSCNTCGKMLMEGMYSSKKEVNGAVLGFCNPSVATAPPAHER